MWDFHEGQAVFRRLLNRLPKTWARRRYGFSTLLPQILTKFGYHSALHVALDDDIQNAMVEFWRRILTESSVRRTSGSQILLIEFWTDAGLLSAIFTTTNRQQDEPIVCKLASARILNEYDSLPNPLNDRFHNL